jgi:glycosyltransferase involved in cell wall biosynthesis
MRVLIATDAWHPQINGWVRTLASLADGAKQFGVKIEFLTPDGFASLALPTYASIRLALPGGREIARRIEAARPDAIHVATEGPIGFAVRTYCLRHRLPFTTSYATRFPEYISVRAPIPEFVSYAVLRRFHSAAAATMVATPSLMEELRARGFQNLRIWTLGVDTELFAPQRATPLHLPQPVFLTAGRVAIEKNLDAFLALDLPGSKVVVGDGPQAEKLRRKFPGVTFLGLREDREFASMIAAADVFVFPSRTDTFGLVQLEALACGVPVAAFPVMGPKDVIGSEPIGVLDNDLRAACLAALNVSREKCRAFALTRSWTTSARQFIANLTQISTTESQRIYAA